MGRTNSIARDTTEQGGIRREPAYKPGSVEDGHSSATPVARRL